MVKKKDNAKRKRRCDFCFDDATTVLIPMTGDVPYNQYRPFHKAPLVMTYYCCDEHKLSYRYVEIEGYNETEKNG